MVKVIRFPTIIQKSWKYGEHIRVGINPRFIENFKSNSKSIFIPKKCVIKPLDTIVGQDEIVGSLYNIGLQNEYLLYTPIRGKIISHNTELIQNINKMYENKNVDNWFLEIKPIEHICGKYHWWY
jgi:hypothetical protein